MNTRTTQNKSRSSHGLAFFTLKASVVQPGPTDYDALVGPVAAPPGVKHPIAIAPVPDLIAPLRDFLIVFVLRARIQA